MRIIEQKVIVSILLFLLAFGAFSFSLKNDFVWDDIETIEKSYHSFQASEIISVLIPPENEAKKARYYRPVFYASIVADKSLWGIHPFGFHLSNLIFHSLATVFVYLAAIFTLREFKFNKASEAALIAGVLFALHPMHAESVSWVAGRTDVLAGLFFFGAFLFHLMSMKNSAYLVAAALFFALSLLSKEVAVAFPIVVLGFDYIARRRILTGENLIRFGIYLLITGLYFYLRGRAFVNIPDMPAASGTPVEAVEGWAIWEAVKTLLSSHLYYLNKLAIPVDPNAFITTVPTGTIYLASAAVLISILATVAVASIRRRENVSAFSILWMLATLGPSSLIAIFPIASTPLAERYLYVPSAGFCLLMGYLIVECRERFKRGKSAIALALIICASYLGLTIERQAVWRDDISLWADASLKSPDHALPHTNYGVALKNAGRTKEAEREFLIALRRDVADTDSGRAVTANNLGVLYLEEEQYGRAEAWFQRAAEFNPDYGLTYYHLGLINFIKGEYFASESDYKKSLEYLSRMLRYYSSYGRGRLLLAKVHLKLGEPDKARAEAKRAIENGLPPGLLKEAEEMIRVHEQSR